MSTVRGLDNIQIDAEVDASGRVDGGGQVMEVASTFLVLVVLESRKNTK